MDKGRNKAWRVCPVDMYQGARYHHIYGVGIFKSGMSSGHFHLSLDATDLRPSVNSNHAILLPSLSQESPKRNVLFGNRQGLVGVGMG